MSPRHPLQDEIVFPPFNGFPPEGLQFLRSLRKNNNRPWFQRNKQTYEENVRFPMQCLIASLALQMADSAPDFAFDPRRSIFRIYRDVRFSKNKAPYKTNVAASFELKNSSASGETAGLYVGIEPGEIFIGGGIYMPSGEQLKGIRRMIADRPDEFLAVVGSPAFRRRFGGILGEKLSKAPLGYPRDHRMISYLQYKQFYVGVELEDKACRNRRFLDTVIRTFNDALPFVRWIAAASS